MTRKAYELKYKKSQESRKVYTAVQFHNSEAKAIENGQSFIRNNGYFEAVVLSAVELVDFQL